MRQRSREFYEGSPPAPSWGKLQVLMPSPSPLGALISAHRCGRWLTLVKLLASPVLMLMLMLMLMGAGTTVGLFVFPEERPLAASVTLATVGPAGVALGGLLLVVWWRLRHTRVLLHGGGIVELAWQKRRELLWQDVASFSYVTIATGAYADAADHRAQGRQALAPE